MSSGEDEEKVFENENEHDGDEDGGVDSARESSGGRRRAAGGGLGRALAALSNRQPKDSSRSVGGSGSADQRNSSAGGADEGDDDEEEEVGDDDGHDDDNGGDGSRRQTADSGNLENEDLKTDGRADHADDDDDDDQHDQPVQPAGGDWLNRVPLLDRSAIPRGNGGLPPGVDFPFQPQISRTYGGAHKPTMTAYGGMHTAGIPQVYRTSPSGARTAIPTTTSTTQHRMIASINSSTAGTLLHSATGTTTPVTSGMSSMDHSRHVVSYGSRGTAYSAGGGGIAYRGATPSPYAHYTTATDSFVPAAAAGLSGPGGSHRYTNYPLNQFLESPIAVHSRSHQRDAPKIYSEALVPYVAGGPVMSVSTAGRSTKGRNAAPSFGSHGGYFDQQQHDVDKDGAMMMTTTKASRSSSKRRTIRRDHDNADRRRHDNRRRGSRRRRHRSGGHSMNAAGVDSAMPRVAQFGTPAFGVTGRDQTFAANFTSPFNPSVDGGSEWGGNTRDGPTKVHVPAGGTRYMDGVTGGMHTKTGAAKFVYDIYDPLPPEWRTEVPTPAMPQAWQPLAVFFRSAE